MDPKALQKNLRDKKCASRKSQHENCALLEVKSPSHALVRLDLAGSPSQHGADCRLCHLHVEDILNEGCSEPTQLLSCPTLTLLRLNSND